MCPSLASSLFSSIWCYLTAWSGGLQSLQIILLGILTILGSLRFFWKFIPARRVKSSQNILKKVISVESGRLTALEAVGDHFLTGGFSGIVYKLNSDRVTDQSAAIFGLIRVIHVLPGQNMALVGNDEGILYSLDLSTWKTAQLGGFGAPIYRVVDYVSKQVCLALGNGETVICDLRSSPGQEGLMLKILNREKRHEGSVFDVAVNAGEALSTVGADGMMRLSYAKSRRKEQLIQPTEKKQAIWSIAALAEDRYITAANDGSLTLIQKNVPIATAKVHKASVRNISVSPQRKWCASVGKDRAVYATAEDLSDSILLHVTKDYGYQVFFAHGGERVVVCDGAGEVTVIDLRIQIDKLSPHNLEHLVK